MPQLRFAHPKYPFSASTISIFYRRQLSTETAARLSSKSVPVADKYTHKFVVECDYDGITLGRYLKKKLNLPHSLIHRLLRNKKIKLSSSDSLSIQTPLRGGAIVAIRHPNLQVEPDIREPPNLTDDQIQLIRSWVVYQDDYIIAINKPSGFAVQRGSKVKDSVDELLPGLQYDFPEPPRLVHRIDKATSGLLLLGRTHSSTAKLTEMFKKSSMSAVERVQPPIEKLYYALLSSAKPVSSEWETISSRLKLSSGENNYEIVRPSDDGRLCETRYSIIASNPGLSLALTKIHPITGHKHQIRSHFTHHLCSPIVSDYKYGYRQCDLHSFLTAFTPNASHEPQSLSHLSKKNSHSPLFLHLGSIRIKNYLEAMSGENYRMVGLIRKAVARVVGDSTGKPGNSSQTASNISKMGTNPNLDSAHLEQTDHKHGDSIATDGDLLIQAPLPMYFVTALERAGFNATVK